MKRLVALMLFFFAVSMAAAQDIGPQEVNNDVLKSWLRSKGYDSKTDEDGDLTCQASKGGKFYVIVESDKKLIHLLWSWSKPDGLSTKLLREKANDFNREKVFVRFSVNDKGSVYAEYFLVYDGGINKTNFLETVDWFEKVGVSWVDAMLDMMD